MHDLLIQWASYWEGNLAWVAIATLFVISGLIIIPRPAICVVAGLTFGLAALPMALIASTIGSLIAFVFARYFFRDRFVRMLERRPKARMVVEAIDAEGWRLLLLLRLASPIPGPISNYAFGLSSMPWLHYTVATVVGIAPQVFAFLYIGAIGKEALDARSLSSARTMFGIAGAVVLLLVIAMITKRVRQKLQTKLNGSPKPDGSALPSK